MINVRELAKHGAATRAEETLGRQITLPWSAAANIAIRSVTIRLGRAAITASGVILGIAFLSYILTGKVAQDVIERDIAQRSRMAQVETQGTQAGALIPGQKQAAEEAASRAARQTWLVVMSLLVCAVGITNSMLMSVTERFREIGTMKCLGALDTFIVRIFLVEATLIGILGSVAGALIGLLGGLLVYSSHGGWDLPAKMHWGTMLVYLLICVLSGTLISLAAAVLPALRASRMPAAAALASEV